MSSIGYGPLWRIDGPPPSAPPYGLLQAAAAPAGGVRFVIDLDNGDVVDLTDARGEGRSMDEVIAELRAAGSVPARAGEERWLNGVEVFPYPPDTGHIHNACSTGTTRVKAPGAVIAANPQFNPITAYLTETCKSYRIGDQAAYRARAVAALDAIESSVVARHFLTGEGEPLNPHLADGNADILNGGVATNAMNALALLEGAIAATGRQGIIHCSPQFAEAASFGRLSLDNRSGVIRTINGTVVIPDAGYAVGATPTGGSSPTGTQEWVYATGPIDIRRTETLVLPEELPQALDRENNEVTYYAERYYLVDWDTELHSAVLVDRCQAGC